MTETGAERWIGPLDNLLRTGAALLAYISSNAIQEVFKVDPPFYLGEMLSVGLALLLSGLFSRRLWAWPRLDVQWKDDAGVVLDQDQFEFRGEDERERRVITHEIHCKPRSLVSWLIFRKVIEYGVRLELSLTPGGLLRLSEDLDLDGFDFRTSGPSAYTHALPTLDRSGVVALGRIEIEPVVKGFSRECIVGHRMVAPTLWGTFWGRLVIVRARVTKVRQAV